MNFNRTSGSFFRNEKLFVLNNPLILPERSRNFQDIIQYYTKSSEKKSTISTYENKNLNASFRKEIKSLKDKRKQEFDNFHKNYLNEYYKRDFEIETEKYYDVDITKKEKNFSLENKKLNTNKIIKSNNKHSKLGKNIIDDKCTPVKYKDNFSDDKFSDKIPNLNAFYLENKIKKAETIDVNRNLNSKIGILNDDLNSDKNKVLNTANNINAFKSINQSSSNINYNCKTIDYIESKDYKDKKIEKNFLYKNTNKKINNLDNYINTNTTATIDSLNKKIYKFSSNDYNFNSLTDRLKDANENKIFNDYFYNKKSKDAFLSNDKDSIKISSPDYTSRTAETKIKIQNPYKNKENFSHEENLQKINNDKKPKILSSQLKNNVCQQKEYSIITPTKETIELESENACQHFLTKELDTNLENIEIKSLDNEIKTISDDIYENKYNNNIDANKNTSYTNDLSLDEYTNKIKISNTYKTIENKDSFNKETFDGNLNFINNLKMKNKIDSESTQRNLSSTEKVKDNNSKLNSKKNNLLKKNVDKIMSNRNRKILLSSLIDGNENSNNGLKKNKKSQHVRYNFSKFSNADNINSESILYINDNPISNDYNSLYKENFIQTEFMNFKNIQKNISRNNFNRKYSCVSISNDNNDEFIEHSFQKHSKTPKHSSNLNSFQNSFSKDKFKKSKETIIGKGIETFEKENDLTNSSRSSAKHYIDKYYKEKQDDIQKNFEKSIYYQQSQMIKSYNSTYENLNTISTSSLPVTQEVSNLDKNFYYKPIIAYSETKGKDSVRSFVEKTKFLSKQNYLKTIQEERCVRIKEEFSNKIEEANLKIQDYKDYKKLFFEDFMQTLDKYTRYCIKQKDKERQELTRLMNESNNSELELLKLKRQIEKLFQCFSTYSEYKRFLLCVKYRIRNSIFYEYFMKQGGNGKVKVEIKNAIFMDNLRKKNITRIKNLKKNNNNLDGRRNSIFCSSHRVKKNKSININLENQESQDKIQKSINNNVNKITEIKEEKNNSIKLLNKNDIKKDLKASFALDNLKTNKKQDVNSKDDKFNNNNDKFKNFNDESKFVKEKNNKIKDFRTNKNMVLFKNLILEGTGIKSIPIIEGNQNPMSSSRDFSNINSILPSKKNSSSKTNNLKISSKNINKNESSSLEKTTSKNDLNESPNKEYSSSNIISEFNPNKNILKSSDNKSKSRSVKNIINLIEIENKKNNNVEVVNKISEFSALLRSLKKLNDDEKAKKFILNKSSLKSKNSIINTQLSSNTTLNSFANNINNQSSIFSINSNRKNIDIDLKANSNAKNKKAEDYFLHHYDKSLEFINGINNQNEDVKKLIIAKNSKGFMLVNKFFNPYNKSEKEKQNLLARMLEEYNTKNIEIFESVEEFNDILAEMQHRNLDLINIYNKNSIIVKDLYFRKLKSEKNNTLDVNLISINEKMEKQLNEQKQMNFELKAILKANEEKHENLRVNESLFSKILKIFENLKVLKNKVNDNFVIYDDIHPNVNIYESLQIFKTLEKCISFLLNRFDKYKSEEKYRIELNKILKDIEFEKKRKLALIEKEMKEAAKMKYYESYTDKCFRSEMNSNKRKMDVKYNFFEKMDKFNDKNKEDSKDKLYNQYLESLQEGE